MSTRPILVTGAAGGQQGATGRTLVGLLRDRGLPVRALVHAWDERAERLAASGAEVVTGDLLDLTAMRVAADGARAVYFTYPVKAGLLHATAVMAAAARDNQVTPVVALSQLSSDPTTHSPRSREHWLAEQILDWAGVEAVHLRAGVFYENLRRQSASDVAAQGQIRLPMSPGTVVPWVAADDVAAVAAALLGDDTSQHDPGVLSITGQTLTLRETADIVSAGLGRPVAYRHITADQWRAEHTAREGHGNPEQTEHLSRLWETLHEADLGSLGDLTDWTGLRTVQQHTGRPASTLAGFVAEHAAAFKQPDAQV